jgi:hypothetical protein
MKWIVNYLIKQKTIEEITNHTHIPFLDVVKFAKIPSEMILSEGMGELIERRKYGLYYSRHTTGRFGV